VKADRHLQCGVTRPFRSCGLEREELVGEGSQVFPTGQCGEFKRLRAESCSTGNSLKSTNTEAETLFCYMRGSSCTSGDAARKQFSKFFLP